MDDEKPFDAEKQLKVIKGTLDTVSNYKVVKYAAYAAGALALLYVSKYFFDAAAGTITAYKGFSKAINS